LKLLARTTVILLTIITMSLSTPARSDYQTGVDAYSNGNFKLALQEWMPLAEGGDATAQNSVGALYDHGLGVDEDDATAAYWYQLAADQNLPLAMRNIANMYAGGYGVQFDEALAESWYEKAARMGDPVAIKRMASLRPSSEFAAAAEPTTAAEAAPVPPTPPAEPMTVAGDDQVAEAVPAPAPEPAPAPAAEPAPAPAAAPTESPATAQSDSDQPTQYGDTGSPAPAAAATPAATQQAALAPPPASDPGNWLIGMWQGPALGCPPDGGLEFLPGETLSYYGGQIAARLKAKYEVAGDRVKVTSTGVDGVGSIYEYERRGPDTFVIAAVPADMPSAMIGVEHRRCGIAPKMAAAPAPAPEAVPAPTPAPQAAAPTPEPFVPEEPIAEAQPAPKPVPVEPVTEAPQPAAR